MGFIKFIEFMVHIRSSSVGLIRVVTYVLNEGTLVLEGVTLAQVVELVVEVLVDLAGGTVADEETTENTHAAHPEDLAKQRKKSNISNCVPVPVPSGESKTGRRETKDEGGVRTWANGHPWYPCAYPDRGDGRCGGPR